MSQRKQVDLGKIISRMVAANFVAELGAKGFREDLIRNCVETIKQEVSTLVSSFRLNTNLSPVEAYTEQGSWQEFC